MEKHDLVLILGVLKDGCGSEKTYYPQTQIDIEDKKRRQRAIELIEYELLPIQEITNKQSNSR